MLLSLCSCTLILGFLCVSWNEEQTCKSTLVLERSWGATVDQAGGTYICSHDPALKQPKWGSAIHLFLRCVERKERVNNYWLGRRGVGVRDLLTASLAEWLLLALLSMSCTTQVSGCPWQMLFVGPVRYLRGARWPLGLSANMQRDAYQFKLRGGPPRDQGM